MLARCAGAAVLSLVLAACSSSSEDAAEGTDQDLVSACAPRPTCTSDSGPTLAPARGFDHISSSTVTTLASPNHRGRDQIYTAGEAQWVIAKLAYGTVDKDLEDEAVDIFVERGCGGSWEKLGSTRTSTGDGTQSVDGVADAGGRVFFQIPPSKTLELGRHRVRVVVTGDHSSTDMLIDVVKKDTPIVVSDVDGTLTSSEFVEFSALLQGELPAAQPDAAAALGRLASKGYRIVYLTARPEWLGARTHEFLATRGFPAGIVHTTSSLTGAIGGAAAEFKTGELDRLRAHHLVVAWGFGNQASDTDAYDRAAIEPRDHRIFLGQQDAHGGRTVTNYGELLPSLASFPAVCSASGVSPMAHGSSPL